ncbi:MULTISPECIES: 4-(cytidine 5'-diphospho)-2-C-methyl-D-erythritol kinase [unclassified Paludibacterium]|uniref:4-(cytidine 5'-diphospho)-2-C-methyl-D-erythritol kinase n=1 Tax=unclassified Paludibacterium TaxID=2618429 RepID=UPI001C043B1B|nr:4-(cytidine 5'-diphospho)-2-C-methyl-D-erythritol kinase [Paludibacterium sp. B53371]BEV73278.1 4-(cytidine 5'-diphospho)-2-C-methyl-D-erythritol kinase [Paludibacterium sp. THUN1379]
MNAFQSYPAPAKLNLMLKVVGRRSDGYHLLETVFRFVDYGDDVLVALRDDGRIVLHDPIPGVAAEADLTVRAARLLQKETGCQAGADLRVSKRIPMGGGLGGGSSDAATVLMVLNRLWETGLSRERLMEIGLSLGADVPVFIFGQNAFARGVGEELTALSLPEKWYVVLHPGVHVPTAEIFSSPLLTRDSKPSIMPILETTQQAGNDLQGVVIKLYPAVKNALDELGKFGSPLMTGSGSCVFLECGSENEAARIFRLVSEKYNGFVAKGLDHHPLYDTV